MAVLRAIGACQVSLKGNGIFDWEMSMALAHRYVRSYLSIFVGRGGSALLNSFQISPKAGDNLWSLSGRLRLVGDVAEENQ